MKSKLIVPYKVKTPLGNFEYKNIWLPESFAKKIESDIPTPQLLAFIEKAEPLVDNYWITCIAALLTNTINPNSKIEKCRIMYRAAVLERIIKKRWNSRFSANLRLPKKELGIFKLEADLWNCAIDLMMELSLISPLRYDHTPIWFTLCMMEGSLGAYNPTPDKKVAFRKSLQSENQALKDYINPFNRENSPSTWLLIESGRVLAEQHDEFRKQKYTPLRKAREKLTTHLINTPAQIITEDTLKNDDR